MRSIILRMVAIIILRMVAILLTNFAMKPIKGKIEESSYDGGIENENDSLGNTTSKDFGIHREIIKKCIRLIIMLEIIRFCLKRFTPL